MSRITIKATPMAKEKFDEIINGSKEKISEFFKNIDKYIEQKDYDLFMEGIKTKFYYKKCKNVYVIFVIEDENTIGIVDFLTESEFNERKEKK